MRANRSETPRAYPQNGATKFSTVPIAEVPAPAVAGDSGADRPVVLVVNQEPDIADAVSEILNRNGYAAIPAYDAEDAMETALLIPPELVVADAGLQGRSGVEVANVLKAKLPDCKVLLLSAQAAKFQLAAKAGAGHISNGIGVPVHPAELLAQVSLHLKPQ